MGGAEAKGRGAGRGQAGEDDGGQDGAGQPGGAGQVRTGRAHERQQAQAGDKQRTGGSVAERPIDRRTNEQLHEQTNQETNSGVHR